MWFEKLLRQLVDRAAERWPDREALRFEGRRWTFAEQRAEIDRAAKALISAGVRHGDHVCLWLGNVPEYLFVYFAVAKVGAVLVPINTRFRTRDMAYIAVQSDATTLIAADRAHGVDYLGMIEELLPDLRQQRPDRLRCAAAPRLERVILLADRACAGTLDWADVLSAGTAVPDAELRRRSAAVDPDGTYTSWTPPARRAPKGVMQRHNVIRNVSTLETATA